MSLLKKIGIPLLLITVSSLLALALGEVGLRLFRPVQYLKPPTPVPASKQGESLYRPSSIPGLTYEMVPLRNGTFEGMQVRTNRFGMRGGDPAPPGPSLIRVAILGDSFTFGFGVAEEQTYARRLERILDESPAGREHRFEVLNLGVVGYTTRDEAVVLKRKALPLDPSLVIIGYVLNDPEIDPRQSLHKYFDPPVWWRRYHVLRLLHLGWNWLDVYRLGGGDYVRYLHAPGREKWESVVTAFRAIGEATRDRRARVMLVIFPMVPREGWAGYPYRDIHLRIAQTARVEGFEVVDLLPVFSRHSPREIRLTPEDDHPGPIGHELAARAIAEAISSSGILSPAMGGAPRPSYLSPRR